jgi:hypothetical protein
MTPLKIYQLRIIPEKARQQTGAARRRGSCTLRAERDEAWCTIARMRIRTSQICTIP